MLDACNKGVGGKAKLTWVDAEFLEKQKRAAVGRHAGVDPARR